MSGGGKLLPKLMPNSPFRRVSCSGCRKRSAAKGVRSLFFVFGTLSVTFSHAYRARRSILAQRVLGHFFVRCCFPHLQVVNNFPVFYFVTESKSLKVTSNDWKRLNVTESDWKRLKVTENDWNWLKVDENWGWAVEIVKNKLLRLRTECGANNT